MKASNAAILVDAVQTCIPRMAGDIDAATVCELRGILVSAVEAFRAQQQAVDPALVLLVRNAYPADKAGTLYTDDELAEFVWSAWANGWSPIPADGDCYPLRSDKGVIAADTFGMLRDAFNSLIADRGYRERTEFRKIIDADERDYYGMKNANDEACICTITLTDDSATRRWYAALDDLRKAVGYSVARPDSRAILADIEQLIGQRPEPYTRVHEAVGIFWADEHDTDIPLRKFRGMTPYQRARGRAQKRAWREILPFAGARRANTVITGMVTASEDEVAEREAIARGHAVTTEEARDYIARLNKEAEQKLASQALYRDNDHPLL